MPTSKVRVKGYSFTFYSSDQREPAHIHVKEGGKHAKFWLEPSVRLAKNVRRLFADDEINELYNIIEEHLEELLREWHEHFGSTA